MTIHRIIHPSGHGAFFTERIHEEGHRDINVVYDCGCKEESEKDLLRSEVSDFFKDGNTIDILFISHFDSDHVNGIELLMPYINKETRVFLPFSYEYLYIAIDSTIMVQMGNTLKVLEQKTDINRLYWVKYSRNGDEQQRVVDYREVEGPMIESGKGMGVHYNPSGTGQYKWLYIPFNFYDDKVYREKLEKAVAAEWGVKPKDIDPSRLDEIAISKFRQVYRSIGSHNTNTSNERTNKTNGSKNINDNSLLVLSKSASYNCETVTKAIPFLERLSGYGNYYRTKHFAPGDGSCLYTGDSNLGTKEKVRQLQSIINRFTGMQIELFQLPHHGSRQYYCRELLTDYDLFFHLFVNCGAYDFRQKSFPQLFRDVEDACRRVFVVSGKKYCRLEQTVSED